ncbi:YggS family pyridoxal phosphate-dependent enzyme [Maricaulis salignorans]|uniref:YggS family pyridoxal phosphate-dependent enzyme n=1 Tax=Maricaulis salignorans TaxID=144026 RepID=UPI000B846992|nr:YggS family pyridoxal phosphate-dependent enzyme [Maricaulis salignorans]
MDTSPEIAARRTHLLAQLGAAAQQAGRNPSDITLVAVSKRQSDEAIDAALDAGQRVFGENRVQEAFEHWGGRRAGIADLELRLIGPLQSNKAQDAVELFDVIETLDRDKLAIALRKAMTATGRTPRLLVQVNTGEEPQKAGIAPAELPGFLARMSGEHGLQIAGLMCIPPTAEPAGLHFALLARLARENGLEELSMGMSADFETAIALGASSVRIGTAFFGARD